MFSAEIKVLCDMMNSVLTLHNVLLADSYFLYNMFQDKIVNFARKKETSIGI